MSANANNAKVTPPAPRWRLWVDGCGGFLLLTGDRWTVGGLSHKSTADVCVRADWPRLAGTIERADQDYFWRPVDSADRRDLITASQPLPIEGSAVISLIQPSPLCESAVLSVRPPHRFDQHVDGVVLVNETLLVGPTADCHIRCRESSDRAVITRKDDRWLAKTGLDGDFAEFCPGQRMNLRTLAMTLEQA